MKKLMAWLMILSYMLVLPGCAKKNEEVATMDNTESIAATEIKSEVFQFLSDKYDLKFKLWGPEGHDLYAYHIYPDYAEWECHILMPENTDDIDQYQRNLSWKIEEDKLIVTSVGGEWQETLVINISEETATSIANSRVYKIYAIEPNAETEPTGARTLDCNSLREACADSFSDPSKVTVLGGEWAYTADPNKFVALATVRYTVEDNEYVTAEIVMVGMFGGKTELFHHMNEHSPYTRENVLQEFGAIDDQRFPLE